MDVHYRQLARRRFSIPIPTIPHKSDVLISSQSVALNKESLVAELRKLIKVSKRAMAYVNGAIGSGRLTSEELAEKMIRLYEVMGNIEGIVFGYNSLANS